MADAHMQQPHSLQFIVETITCLRMWEELTAVCSSGDVVEDTVNKVLSGKGGEKKEEEEKKEEGGGGGFNVGDVLSLAGGDKDKEQGGGEWPARQHVNM